MCVQRRLRSGSPAGTQCTLCFLMQSMMQFSAVILSYRSGWASAQSDQSLRCPHELRYPLSAQRRLIRLGGFSGWSESSLGAHHFVGFVMERLILCRSSKLPNQSYIMFKEQEQYPKSTRCMLLFRLVLFAEPCLTILRWLEKRYELYWTTGDLPWRSLVVTRFEIVVYCQLLFIPTSSIWFWHLVLVYQING